MDYDKKPKHLNDPKIFCIIWVVVTWPIFKYCNANYNRMRATRKAVITVFVKPEDSKIFLINQLVSPSGMVETPRLQAKKSLVKWSRE